MFSGSLTTMTVDDCDDDADDVGGARRHWCHRRRCRQFAWRGGGVHFFFFFIKMEFSFDFYMCVALRSCALLRLRIQNSARPVVVVESLYFQSVSEN